MEKWKTMRKKWTDARDSLKVPKGAAKVSIGDSIEAVYKKAQAGIRPMRQALTALKNNLATYRSATDKKYPKIGAWIKDNLDKEIVDVQTRADKDEKTLAAIKAANDEKYVGEGSLIFSTVTQDVGKVFRKQTTWETFKTSGYFPVLARLVPAVQNFGKFLDQQKFVLKLPGKEDAYKKFAVGSSFAGFAQVLASVRDAARPEDLTELAKKHGALHIDWENARTGIDGAIKSLLG